MSSAQKDWLSKWLPLLIAILSQIAIVAYGYGKIEQRINPLEQHVLTDTTEKSITLFVTRSEWEQMNRSRAQQLEEQTKRLERIEAKLDRLIER